MTRQVFESEGTRDINVNDIEFHPDNPRPHFHLGDDNIQLRQLGESIKVDGQRQDAVVYEMVGGWRNENSPGKYRLYQGERRLRACRLVGVETLSCRVAKAPQTESEEWDWLGAESAFKQDWSDFYFLRYCWQLAESHGINVHSQEVATKTGATMSDLLVAKKLSRLSEPVQKVIEDYERLKYEQTVNGQRNNGGRIRVLDTNTKEFPVRKAAAVYDVFIALREECPMLVREFSDEELQMTITEWATTGRATIDDLTKLAGTVRQLGSNPPAGLLGEIKDLLVKPDKSVRSTLRATGNVHVDKLRKLVKSSNQTRRRLAAVSKVVGSSTSDPLVLEQVREEMLLLYRDANELERLISDKILEEARA